MVSFKDIHAPSLGKDEVERSLDKLGLKQANLSVKIRMNPCAPGRACAIVGSRGRGVPILPLLRRRP